MKKLLLLISLIISPLLHASNTEINESAKARSNGIYHNNYAHIILDMNSFKNDEIIKARQSYEREYMLFCLRIDGKDNINSQQTAKTKQATEVLDETIHRVIKVLNKQCINDFDQLGFPLCFGPLVVEGEQYQEYFNKLIVHKIFLINNLTEMSQASNKKILSLNAIEREVNHVKEQVNSGDDLLFQSYACNLIYQKIISKFCIESLAKKNPPSANLANLKASYAQSYGHD